MAQTNKQVERLLTGILLTQDDELDCQACDEQLSRVLDLLAEGADLETLLPEVAQHLRCCSDCHEECEALMAILRAEASGELGPPLD